LLKLITSLQLSRAFTGPTAPYKPAQSAWPE
jgi:hypothetical protein